MSRNQQFGYGFGAVYLAVGLVGFIVTRGVGFAETHGNHLIFFELNPLHNIVHLAVGGLLVGGATAGLLASRAVNVTVGAVYLLVGLAGLMLVGKDANILAINHPDNGLHLATALLGITVGLAFDRSATAARRPAAAPR